MDDNWYLVNCVWCQANNYVWVPDGETLSQVLEDKGWLVVNGHQYCLECATRIEYMDEEYE